MPPSNKPSSLLPWIEASTVLGTVVVAAIATSAVSLYQINEIDEKVDKIATAVETLTYTQGITKHEIKTLKSNDEKTLAVFVKLSDSIDKLSIAVAKLEVKTNGG